MDLTPAEVNGLKYSFNGLIRKPGGRWVDRWGRWVGTHTINKLARKQLVAVSGVKAIIAPKGRQLYKDEELYLDR